DNLMLEKAIAKYGVNTSQSFMLGDSDRDVGAAKKTGLKVFKILSNHPPDLQQLQEIQQIASVTFPVV
ncbi:MAG TPA: HAD hydrolase-like protein, partial [Bacteroidia bacterium]|nr:HAD hydrolase-like protein [Bacteroidia bacterium]